MCPVIHHLVRPNRHPRQSDLRGQSSISNRMIAPPSTPYAKPGGLPPPGQSRSPSRTRR